MSQGYVAPKTLRCPRCGSAHLQRSRRRNLLLTLLLMRRYHCAACDQRFRAFVWLGLEERPKQGPAKARDVRG